MQAESPPPARSKELSSGSSSSHPARRRGGRCRCGAAEKSGARNGLASCREITDCGTTRRSGAAGGAGVTGGGTSSGAGSTPAACQHVALDRPGRVGDDGVLGEQRQQPGVPDGGRREDRRDAVQALELLGPTTVAAGRRPGRGRARRAAAGRRPGTSCARQASRGRAGRPPRPHGRLGRAPGRRRRRGGRVAASAGRHGERPSGAGLVEPRTPPLQCRARVAAAACRTAPPDGRGRSEAPAWCLERRAACGSEGSTPRVSAISSRERRATTGGPVTSAGHAVGRPPPWSEPHSRQRVRGSPIPVIMPGRPSAAGIWRGNRQ